MGGKATSATVDRPSAVAAALAPAPARPTVQVGELMLAAAARLGGDLTASQLKRMQVGGGGGGLRCLATPVPPVPQSLPCRL